MPNLQAPGELIPLGDVTRHVNKDIAVVGVVVSTLAPKRCSGGDQDWMLTIELRDTSNVQGSPVKVRLFYKSQRHLPVLAEPQYAKSQILLLKRVMYSPGMAILVGNSKFTTWVLSKKLDDGMPKLTCGPTADVKLLTSENKYINLLRQWWMEKVVKGMPALVTQVQASTTSRSYSKELALVKDLEFNKFYELYGEVIKSFWGSGNHTIYITDYTQNTRLHSRSPDDDSAHRWIGPWGKYTLQITLWDENAEAARDRVREGMFIRLTNLRTKMNGDGRLEGALHGDQDRMYAGRVKFSIVDDNDPEIRGIKVRKTEYWRRYESGQEAAPTQERASREFAASDEESEYPEPESNPKSSGMPKPNNPTPGPTDHTPVGYQKNPYIRSTVDSDETPVTPISEIIKPHESGDAYRNHKYHVFARVVDFVPNMLEDFSKQCEVANFESDEELSPEALDGRQKRWIWRFALLLEGPDKALLRVIVHHKNAEYLLRMPACDLREDGKALGELRHRLFKLAGNVEERKNFVPERIRSRGQVSPKGTSVVSSDFPSHSELEGLSKKARKKRKRELRKRAEALRANKSAKISEDASPRPSAERFEGDNEEEGGDGETRMTEMPAPDSTYFHAWIVEYGVKKGDTYTRLFQLTATTLQA